MYPLEGATGGGDKLTLKGSNLAEVRHISGVEVECKVDGVLTPAVRGRRRGGVSLPAA